MQEWSIPPIILNPNGPWFLGKMTSYNNQRKTALIEGEIVTDINFHHPLNIIINSLTLSQYTFCIRGDKGKENKTREVGEHPTLHSIYLLHI
jgi:hypothetical protein